MIHPNIQRAIHLVSGAILGVLTLFTPRNKKRIIFNSSLNNFFNFNSRYLFDYFIKNSDFNCFFIINDDHRRESLIKAYGKYFISSRGILNKLFILNAGCWITSTMETPVGGALLAFRRFVYNLGHGVPIKKAGIAQEKYLWYKSLYYKVVGSNFTKFLATSEYTKDRYAKMYGVSLNKIAINPQPRMSAINIKNERKLGEEIKVLYAPTWREGGTAFFPYLDANKEKLESFLKEKNIHIFLNPHPVRTSFTTTISESEYVKVIKPDPNKDVMGILENFDVLITDYSSIYVDYLKLNRPIIFSLYDEKSFSDEIGLFDAIKDFSVGPKINTQEELIRELDMIVSNQDKYVVQRKELGELLNGALVDNECETNLDYIRKQLE